MTRITSVVGFMMLGGLLVGCGNSNSPRKADEKLSVNPAVTDITPVSTPVAPAPAPAVAAQPVVYESAQEPMAAADVATPAPSPAPARSRTSRSTASVSGTKYKVRKGDTLWKIAQVHYGDGNKWQRIASANPKINPDHVMAGQTIVIP